MSTLTDVIRRPATAAAELDRLREVERKALDQSEYIQAHGLTEWEMALKDAEIDRLREQNKRLTWALRAIDTRLHAEMAACERDEQMLGRVMGSTTALTSTEYVIPARTLRQMCSVAVSATAERPEGAA